MQSSEDSVVYSFIYLKVLFRNIHFRSFANYQIVRGNKTICVNKYLYFVASFCCFYAFSRAQKEKSLTLLLTSLRDIYITFSIKQKGWSFSKSKIYLFEKFFLHQVPTKFFIHIVQIFHCIYVSLCCSIFIHNFHCCNQNYLTK